MLVKQKRVGYCSICGGKMTIQRDSKLMCGGTCRSRKKRGAKPFIDQKQDAFYQALNAFKIATLDKKFPISETEFRDLKQAQQVLADIMDGVQVQRELLFEVGSGS